jgi:predicted ester cyclase
VRRAARGGLSFFRENGPVTRKADVLDFWAGWARTHSPSSKSPLFAPALEAHICHPANGPLGPEQLDAAVLGPLARALPDVERRTEIAIDGEFRGSSWVACQGHYVGVFEAPLFSIPPTGRLVSLRFGEFCRIERGAIVEMYCILDWLDLMRQAGVYPLAPPLGSEDAWAPPSTGDGREGALDPNARLRSLNLVEAMIAGLMQYDGKTLESMAMERFWAPNMLWFGPGGIGSTRGLRGFQDHHQRSFLRAFPDRRGGDHKCRIGEGAYVGSTGWPSIRATHTGGGFLGLPPTGRRITMRVMDFWRRDGEALVENWVFIDLPDLLAQMDLDVFDEMRRRARRAIVPE